MLNGRINRYLSENSLLEQPFVKNPKEKISDLLNNAKAALDSFGRFEVGKEAKLEKKL
jgi:elongation factor Ts